MFCKRKLFQLKKIYTDIATLGLSMRLKLFLFLIVFVFTMLLAAVVMLLLTGTITTGLNESEQILQKGFEHTYEDVNEHFNIITMQTVKLSEDLSGRLQASLGEKGLEAVELHKHPEILEEIMDAEFTFLTQSLQKTQSSGIFMILDATVTKQADASEDSKAGLYIKNMEPNILSSSTPALHVLRGNPKVARNHAVQLSAQWRMEFDVEAAAYYHRPLEQAKQQGISLSRLYYWTPAMIFPGTSEEVMLCSIPLLDPSGQPYGVCGFEISELLFKLKQMPDISNYQRAFCMLAPTVEDNIYISGAMFAGGHSARNSMSGSSALKIYESSNNFSIYQQDNNDSFLGFHKKINMYPQSSPFTNEQWLVALMVPKADIQSRVSETNMEWVKLGCILIFLGILFSWLLSHTYLAPIKKGFDRIKSNNLYDAQRTKIPEIDDLIVYLSDYKEPLDNGSGEAAGSRQQEKQIPAAIQEFLENLTTLSPAERAVFNLYAQQYTAKEIAGILCLSINTIKTHNKRIYAKLKVASRDELLVYINMLKEMGKELSS